VLVTDASETILDTGDCAGFKAGGRDGHHPRNSDSEQFWMVSGL
jgi:uncharacterized cupin superfamily protein